MSYKSIIVNLAIDATPAPIVQVGIELAERFGAHLIGLAAADVPPLVATGDGMVYEGEIMQIQRTEIEKRLAELRAEFEELVPASIFSEWGQAVCSPTRFLSASARAADLVVTGSQKGENVFRAVDVGSLALGIGRPVLVAASNVEHVMAKTVLVAWKDTREARRAVWDALPFLRRAEEVFICAVGDEIRYASARDVQNHLDHHGVAAEVLGLPRPSATVGDEIIQAAERVGADLIVSGAYGHSRMREWVFGGVTRDLLDHAPMCCLMTH